MKCIKNNLAKNLDQLVIIPIGDVHIGSQSFDEAGFKNQIAVIRDNPDTFTILLGDICDCGTKNSVGFSYDAPLSPMEQIKKAVELLKPIKHKILGVVSGNHEGRALKGDGLDLGYFLSVELGVEDLYDPVAVYNFVRFGKTTNKESGARTLVTIYSTHGEGTSGRTAGAKANGLERRGNIITDADICLVGHTHQPLVFKTGHYETDRNNSCVRFKETTMVNCGSNLGYEAYAERMGMRPSSQAKPTIIIGAKEHSNDRLNITATV